MSVETLRARFEGWSEEWLERLSRSALARGSSGVGEVASVELSWPDRDRTIEALSKWVASLRSVSAGSERDLTAPTVAVAVADGIETPADPGPGLETVSGPAAALEMLDGGRADAAVLVAGTEEKTEICLVAGMGGAFGQGFPTAALISSQVARQAGLGIVSRYGRQRGASRPGGTRPS
ncbi:MAG: hypothetical protein D6688_05010 [Alphaproteobacteria bacterium]|nr:MAG: hypothetical protein D6688_05010 [Alphaproteobacteria bacterium]